MKICLISKYPPIEGGVSSRIYWLAKGLGERGHEIHIVTNAQEVENKYKEQMDSREAEYTPKNVYVHSTTSNTNPWHIPFSKAYTERIANLAIEVIRKYNIQLIDSYYILPYGVAGSLAKSITGKPHILHHAGSDIGKINYYWRTKGLAELVEAMKEIKSDFLLLFVANGKGLLEFQNLIREKQLEKKSIFMNFVPPWKIPSIIKLSTCVVVAEREFPIQYHTPILPREVMAVGKCLILSEELYNKGCYGNLTNGENVLVTDPKNIKQFRTIIENIIKHPEIASEIGQNALKVSRHLENFDKYTNYVAKLHNSFLKKS